MTPKPPESSSLTKRGRRDKTLFSAFIRKEKEKTTTTEEKEEEDDFDEEEEEEKEDDFFGRHKRRDTTTTTNEDDDEEDDDGNDDDATLMTKRNATTTATTTTTTTTTKGGGAKKTASSKNKATKRIPAGGGGGGGGRANTKGKKHERKPPKSSSSSLSGPTTKTNFGFARTFLHSEWFQSWLGRVMIYMVVLVVARTLRSVGEGGDGGMRRGALKTMKSGGDRMYENYGKSTCDAIRCDFARAQLKRITREAFRGTAVSAFEQIESNAREGSKSSRVVENGGFDGWESEMGSNANNNNNNNNNKPLVLALVSDDQSDFDAILKPGSTHNPFKMAEKKGCFKRLIVNDPYESSLVTTKNKKKKPSFSLNDPKEIAERRGEVQKELSQFFLECGKKIGGGVVYVRMAKHINVKLLPALLPAFSENGGYTLDGELVPSKDFVFVLEVLKPIIEKSSAFSRERSEYAKALKNGNEAMFTRIVKSKLAFYWGVDEEDESLSANALAMRRRVDYVVPVSVSNKFDI